MTRAICEATNRIRALESELAHLHRSISAEPDMAQRAVAAARLRIARAALQAASAPGADWGLIYDERFLSALHAIHQLIADREQGEDAQQLVMFPHSERKAMS